MVEPLCYLEIQQLGNERVQYHNNLSTWLDLPGWTLCHSNHPNRTYSETKPLSFTVSTCLLSHVVIPQASATHSGKQNLPWPRCCNIVKAVLIPSATWIQQSGFVKYRIIPHMMSWIKTISTSSTTYKRIMFLRHIASIPVFPHPFRFLQYNKHLLFTYYTGCSPAPEARFEPIVENTVIQIQTIRLRNGHSNRMLSATCWDGHTHRCLHNYSVNRINLFSIPNDHLMVLIQSIQKTTSHIPSQSYIWWLVFGFFTVSVTAYTTPNWVSGDTW